MSETITLQPVSEDLNQVNNLVALLRKMKIKEEVLTDIVSVTVTPAPTTRTENTLMQVHIKPHSPTHKKYRNTMFTTHYNRVPVSFKGMETYSVVINENEYGIWDGPINPNILYRAINKIPYLSNDERYPFTGQLVTLNHPNDAVKITPDPQSPVYNQATTFNYIYIYDLKATFGEGKYYQMKFNSADVPPSLLTQWNGEKALAYSFEATPLDGISNWSNPADFPNMFPVREDEIDTVLNHPVYQDHFIKIPTRDMTWLRDKLISTDIALSSYPIGEVLTGRTSALVAQMPHGTQVDYNKTVGVWRIDVKSNKVDIADTVTNYVNIRPFHELVSYIIKTSNKFKLMQDGVTYQYLHDLTNSPANGVYSYVGYVYDIRLKPTKWANGYNCWEVNISVKNYNETILPDASVVFDEFLKHSGVMTFQRNGRTYNYYPYLTSTGWRSGLKPSTATQHKAAIGASYNANTDNIRIDDVNTLSLFLGGSVRYLIKPMGETIAITKTLPGLTV